MDLFFGLDREAPHDADLVRVGTYYDDASLEVALSLLREAEIPFLRRDRGVGGAMRLIAGFNMYGADVFVRKEDEEAAVQLLAPVGAEDTEAPADGGEDGGEA